MARLEFSRKVRRAIIERATGAHGFIECEKCGGIADMKYEIDHILPAELGGTAEVANGMLLCKLCHVEKTGHDVRRIRKADRQRDRATGAIRAKQRIKSAGFPLTRAPRAPKPKLAPKSIFWAVGNSESD